MTIPLRDLYEVSFIDRDYKELYLLDVWALDAYEAAMKALYWNDDDNSLNIDGHKKKLDEIHVVLKTKGCEEWTFFKVVRHKRKNLNYTPMNNYYTIREIER